MSTPRILLVVAAALAAIYLLFLGVRPLILPDEHRYGAMGLEMVARGDVVVPHLTGFRYFEKPVGGTWLIAAAVEVLGASAFAIRLPSALATILAAALLGLGTARGTGRPAWGVLASLAYGTMTMPLILGTTSILDPGFAAFVTGSLVLLFLACTSARVPSAIALLAGAGAMAGAAFLVKGPLAIVLAAIVVGPFLAWERRWRMLLLVPWIPLLVAGAVVMPWAIAVHERQPDYWRTFLWVEHVQRFLEPDPNQHLEPWWFFLAVLPVAILPWTLALPAALGGYSRDDLRRSWIRFLLCWLALPFLFFSASSGKLATYILPVLPAVAALVVIGLARRFESSADAAPPSRLARVPGAILISVGVIAFILALLPRSAGVLWTEGTAWRAAIFAIALAAWGLLDWRAIGERDATRRILWMGLSPVLLFALVPFLYPDAIVDGSKEPSRVVQAHRERLAASPTLLATEQMAIAVAFELGRTDAIVVLEPGELDNGLGDPTEQARLVSTEEFPAFLRAMQARGPVTLLGAVRHLEGPLAAPGMPLPATRIEEDEVLILEYLPLASTSPSTSIDSASIAPSPPSAP